MRAAARLPEKKAGSNETPLSVSAPSSMRERKKPHSPSGVERARAPRGHASAKRQGSPESRRRAARNGGREAMQRRSEIDRSGGLGKSRRVPCDDGDHVAPFAATPATSDTLALRDRRGVRAGVATDLRRRATWLPHHAPPRHDRGAGATRPQGGVAMQCYASMPGVRSVPA